MESYFKDKDTSWYDVPDNIVGVLVNPITGQLATNEEKVKKLFYFLKGTEPYLDRSYDFDSVFKEDILVTADEELNIATSDP
mgnify:FL=1